MLVKLDSCSAKMRLRERLLAMRSADFDVTLALVVVYEKRQLFLEFRPMILFLLGLLVSQSQRIRIAAAVVVIDIQIARSDITPAETSELRRGRLIFIFEFSLSVNQFEKINI